MMKKILPALSNRLSTWMEIVAGAALIGILVLTGSDIVGRALGHPIPGAYEIVSFAGGMIIGLAVPATSRAGGHVMVDLVTGMVSSRIRSMLMVVTQLMGTALFLLMAFSTFKMGIRLHEAGEVTPVLAIPFYPIAYAIAGAFFFESLVLVTSIWENARKTKEVLADDAVTLVDKTGLCPVREGVVNE